MIVERTRVRVSLDALLVNDRIEFESGDAGSNSRRRNVEHFPRELYGEEGSARVTDEACEKRTHLADFPHTLNLLRVQNFPLSLHTSRNLRRGITFSCHSRREEGERVSTQLTSGSPYAIVFATSSAFPNIRPPHTPLHR